MKLSLHMKTFLFPIFLALLASIQSARAQALDEVVYTVGATARDASNRHWGYVLWQGDAPDLVQNKRFAVYAKQGSAAAVNPYARQAIVGVQTEPAVIQVVLNRAANLGDDFAQLESRINNLFQKIIPPGSFSLADKISIVIRGSLNDANHFNNLMALSRLHPSISLCLGMAHATLLEPGETTFEVREFDLANNADIRVVGRVTVQAGIVIELPATGIPIAVPDPSAKGDLNVRLRWGTPDGLRRLSLLNYGFNVYRMSKAFAEGNAFHVTPPSSGILIGLLGNPNVKQLNNQPVLQNKQYTIAEAPNLVLDGTNSFFADDNRRYEPGGVPHQNGDQYYYFVAPRDVLGRIGRVSPGALVTICDRLPPNAPTGVTVVNDYKFEGGVSKQSLRVRWKQDNSGTDTVKNYYVYRWEGPGQVQVLAGNPLLRRIAGPIAHAPGQEFNTYLDDGAGAPAMPADASKTFWYTVRSEDESACGGNLSANSAPAFGVLRDRVGPAAPGGWVDLVCRRPVVVSDRYRSTPDRDQQNQSLAYYNILCTRRDAGIQWAEFWAFDRTIESNYLGRVFFKPTESVVNVRFAIPRSALSGRDVVFFCRVGAPNGLVSTVTVNSGVGIPTFAELREVLFNAHTEVEKFRPTPQRRGDCFRHDPVTPPNPGEPGEIDPIDVTIQLTPGTKEYKLYRRIDFGPLTLVKQGPADFDVVTAIQIPDEALPPNAASICYYGQLFDEHGNPSPLTLLGDDCILVAGTTPLPTPMLAGLQITGTEASPKMTIKWFCPPYGVERFMIHIASKPEIMPASISSVLSDYISPTPEEVVYTEDGVTETNEFFIYRTPRIGPGFGNGAQFDVEVSVAQGRKYTVFIKAVGKDESVGPRSNVEDGIWSPAIVAGPQVPWPARPLPPLNIFSTNLIATRLPASIFDGVGVLIGLTTERTTQGSTRQPGYIHSDQDPMTYIFKNADGDHLFPVAMYRVQVASAAFPVVSGDVVQVTPLMEQIAFNRQLVNGINVVTIVDPFIALVSGAAGTNVPWSLLYLLDTQPVILGAKYLYLLVRFDDQHEIEEVVPSTIVEVTP